FDKVLTHLEGGNVFDKAKKLRDKFPIQRDTEVIYLEFFNQENWCKNNFQVANQIKMVNKYQNRYDVTILINGLPLVQIELKRRGKEIKEAFNQIKRYTIHSFNKGLFHYIQIFVISNGVNTKYFANGKIDELKFEYTFYWKNKENENISRLSDFAETFLERCHLSKMVARYIVLNETNRNLMVLRAYQYYAVEAIVHRALETSNNGYVWHTTGSGKTLTSFKASQILAREESIDKVIFVVDRRDLDNQTVSEFNKFSNNSVDGTDNTRMLVKQLKGNDKLIVTTIQKLTRAIAQKRHKNAMESVKDKKIVMMFDECHRSQFGLWHKQIKEFFNNIQFFGFTGTPIMAVNANNGKTTADLFEERLHSYLIKDGIKDHNVLGFSVDYVSTYKNKSIEDEEVEDIDKKEVFLSDERLKLVCEYIVENHNKKTYDKEFNALFAVSSIELALKYYNMFKSLGHYLNIATIFSYNPNGEIEGDLHNRDRLEICIDDYNNMFKTNFSTDSFSEYYIDVSKKFKNRQI
ncbi:MAG: type I restriction endonuclease subunit R, partial [Methanobacteriaceae archaeon]